MSGQVPEVYTSGYGPQFQRELASRSAADFAGFFTPHLRPGMRLLDCGCGVGSITLDLAGLVAPGEVVGIDVEVRQIDAARAAADERGVRNVRFEVANVYQLPFPDASFDAVFAQGVLEYLREPLGALREMRRCLKPGGIIGVRSPDRGAWLMAPSSPLLDDLRALYVRALESLGTSPTVGRHLRRLVRDAGFDHTEASATTRCFGTDEAAQSGKRIFAEVLRQPAVVETVLAQGWVDRARWEAMCAEAVAFFDRPDAFQAWMQCEVVGWLRGA